jgi:hypothetical protein
MKPNTKVYTAKPIKDQTIDQVLAERKNTHGDFTETAQISQCLEGIIRDSTGYQKLTPAHREALAMILRKIARICTGNPNEEDHWRDISGYSKLAQDRCYTQVGPAVSKRSK